MTMQTGTTARENQDSNEAVAEINRHYFESTRGRVGADYGAIALELPLLAEQ